MALSCHKRLSSLLRRIASKNDGDFYCLSYPHSFRTKNKSEVHKKVFENKDFYNVIMPSEDTKILGVINIKNLIKHHLLFMQILKI